MIKNELQKLEISDLKSTLRHVRLRRLRQRLSRLDLWLFPPLVIYSAFTAAWASFPPHPIKLLGVLAVSFMSATLALFLLRPRSWREQYIG